MTSTEFVNEFHFDCPSCHQNYKASLPVQKDQVPVFKCETCFLQFGLDFLESGEVRENLNQAKLQSGADPILTQLWEQLLFEENDLVLHRQFIETCLSKGRGAFAVQKYQARLEIDPQNAMARAMLDRVHHSIQLMKKSVQLNQGPKLSASWDSDPSSEQTTVRSYSVFVMVTGLVVIVGGLILPEMRLAITMGAATFAVGFGLRLVSF